MSHDPNTERASDANPQNRSEIGVSDSTPAPKNDGRFKPGNNANPGGRPAIAKEFKEKCRQFMSDKGWDKLIEMAQSNSRDARPALELITGYAYGRPVHERVCGQYAPCARLAAFNDYKPTPRELHPTMTTIESSMNPKCPRQPRPMPKPRDSAKSSYAPSAAN